MCHFGNPKGRAEATLPEARSSRGHAAQASDPLSIVGLWRVTFVSDGEVLNDTPAPATGNVYVFDLSGNEILHLDGEIMAERITVD